MAFPAPGTPDGDRWQAAGYPLDGNGQPDVPPAPGPATAPVETVTAGELVGYTSLDVYARPQRERTQVVLVADVAADGTVRGAVLGYAEDLAAFQPGQLHRLS